MQLAEASQQNAAATAAAVTAATAAAATAAAATSGGQAASESSAEPIAVPLVHSVYTTNSAMTNGRTDVTDLAASNPPAAEETYANVSARMSILTACCISKSSISHCAKRTETNSNAYPLTRILYTQLFFRAIE